MQSKCKYLEGELAKVHSSGGSTSTEAAKTIAGVSKPPTFGDSNNFSFQDWVHKLKVYCNALFPSSVLVLQWIYKRTVEVKCGDVPTTVAKDCELDRFCSSLYSILSGFTDGEALRIVRSEDQTFNGFEAFRKLSTRFDPKTAVRGYNLVSRLSKPAQCTNVAKVRDCIMSWEAEVRKYVVLLDRLGSWP